MLREIWICMLIASFLCLASSVVLFLAWGVLDLLDELSGRKAKRQIKMLHELNVSTGVFDNLSTSEIYSSISSGSLLTEELSSIDSQNLDMGDTSESSGEDDEATSLLSRDDSTSFMEDDEVSTGLLEDGLKEDKEVVIKVIEEQSSL